MVYYDNFDFLNAKKYSFYGADSLFSNVQNLSYAQRSRIELAIEKKLASQGFSYSDIDGADLIVTYHWVDKKHKDYLNYNKAVLFCAHCLKANTWVKKGDNWKAFPGGLIIDLVDPQSKRSVWRGMHPLALDPKNNSQKRNDRIIMTVNTILSQYPK